jgi:hypothetical protein
MFLLGLSAVLAFWQHFPFLQKVVLFLFQFFLFIQCHVHVLISNCYLPTFIPQGTICILRITFCNVKFNIGDKESPCFSTVLFSKKDDHVPSILTALIVFCTRVSHMFINFVKILNSSTHFHCVSLHIESYAFFKSINRYCIL